MWMMIVAICFASQTGVTFCGVDHVKYFYDSKEVCNSDKLWNMRSIETNTKLVEGSRVISTNAACVSMAAKTA